MKAFSIRTRYATGLAAAATLHAVIIETRRHLKAQEPEFRQGSADEIIADSLNSGDIVLFSRRWYECHLPTAILVTTQKAFFNCSYDHSGVIVMRLGTPYVLEKTPLRGIMCRPFEDRVRHSSAAHIIVISLDKKAELTIQQSQALKEFSQTATITSTPQSTEIIGFLSGVYQYLRSNVLQLGKSTGFICTNVELIDRAWGAMGLSLAAKDGHDKHQITLQDIADRNVTISGSDLNNIKLSRFDTHIRG